MTRLAHEKPEHRGGKETFKVTSNDEEPTKTVRVKSWEVFENYTPADAYEDGHGQTRLSSSETNFFRYVFSCEDAVSAQTLRAVVKRAWEQTENGAETNLKFEGNARRFIVKGCAEPNMGNTTSVEFRAQHFDKV